MRFAAATWFLSRACIIAALAFAAPHGIIAVLGNWDGAWYGSIVRNGYQYAPDASAHNIAFFPGFPLVASVLYHAGVGWPLAGAIVSNVAFLLSLFVLYSLVARRFDALTARWCVVIMCALPLSLFCSVAYSEGLFLLFAAIALWGFDRERFLVAGIAAAGASATRPLGIALALALVAAAIIQHRKLSDVLKCATGIIGIAAFALFCAKRFGDALAFVHAQPAWRHGSGLDAHSWIGLLRGAAGGRLEDGVALLLLATACAGIVVWRALGVANAGFIALALGIIVAAGAPLSLDRNLYTVIPVGITGALFFRRVPVAGYIACAFFLCLLVADAVAFARFQWVA